MNSSFPTRSYFFEPWIGTAYKEGLKGVKTLIVGVCHFCKVQCQFYNQCATHDGVKNLDLTCPFYADRSDREYYRLSNSNNIEITSFIDGDAPYPAYKLLTYYMLKCSGDLPSDKKSELWEHIAFTNYLQFFHNNSGALPEEISLYEKDYPAFRELVEFLAPEVVYVWNDKVKDCIKSHKDDFRYLGKADLRFGIDLFVFKPKDSKLDGLRLNRIRYQLGIKCEKNSIRWFRTLLDKYLGKCFIQSPDDKERFAYILKELVDDGYLGTTEENLYFADSDYYQWTSRLKGYFLSKIKYSFPDLGRGLNPGIEGLFNERLATNKRHVENPKPWERKILNALDSIFPNPRRKKFSKKQS